MYDLLIKQLPHILEGEKNVITNLANFSAMIFNSLDKLNWVGFYLYTGKELLLGPFQGKPACVRISIGKGVCGTAFKEARTLVVDDADSKSEIVIPMQKNGTLYGVLDIDSPIKNRFDESDRENLEKLLNLLIENTDIEELLRIYQQ